jgi:hypothetical protein
MPQTPPVRSWKRASRSQSLPGRSKAVGTSLLRQWNLVQRLPLDREGWVPWSCWFPQTGVVTP